MQLRKRARAATNENEKEDIDVAPMDIDGAASPDLPTCNACGLVGHSRRSSKHCLQHITRVAERNLDSNEEYSNVTVKVGFKKAIKGIELASAFENDVRTMNLVRIHGSRVVLKYVLDKVQRGLPVGNLQSSEGGIMRQLFVGAFHSFHKDIGAGLSIEDIALSIHEYVMLAKIRQCDLPSIEGLSKSIDTVVMQYQTNCQVYVSTTLWGRVHRWARHLLEIQLPAVFKNCARSKAAATYLMSCLLYEEPSEKERKRPSLQKKLVEFCKKKGLEQELDLALIDVYSILLQHTHCAGLCLNTVYVKTNLDKYFGLMWAILRHFQEYGPKDCESRAQEQRRGRGLRLFNFVPLAQIRNGFVTIDTSGLYELTWNLNINSKKDPPQSASTNIQQQPKVYLSPVQRFLANAEEEWGKVLRLKRVVPKNRSFSYSIKSTIDEFGYKTDDSKEYVPVDLKDRTVLGIDPNRKDLFMAYDGKQKFQVTGKEWRHMCGITAAKKKRDNWLKKRNDIVNANSNGPTSKAERKCYLGHKGVNAKQSRSYNNVFVAFGGGQFSSTSRGHHPIPRRSLINALKQRKIPMRLVDEFRTSMLCCKCKEPLPKRGMWHVKRCDNCNIFWNRDVNAAVNIREVFISVNASNGVRPGKFSRSYKFSSSTKD
ncbi:hypothetical protein MP638_000403 [Amoeboaphelidium occidentale]|nr:hypothetical protein MP638_000403 [Amoeboaphelidium occidentale]